MWLRETPPMVEKSPPMKSVVSWMSSARTQPLAPGFQLSNPPVARSMAVRFWRGTAPK